MVLSADRGGEGAPLLVLLHGLSATREVWQPLRPILEAKWRGRWIAPDLPGHGRSPAAEDYSPASQAAAVERTISAEGMEGEVVVLGHSMGGVVALALAAGEHGARPRRTLALGVKVLWSEAELSGMAARAEAPAKLFADRTAAVDRYLKVSGLAGLVTPDGPIAQAGVTEEGGGWHLAMDPRVNTVGAPDMAALTAAAATQVRLACGAQDAMCRVEDLRRWDPGAEALASLGHNAMVEDPAAVWAWASHRLAAQAGDDG
jgi:pimeloyl-ACP methyl ester carboxylesterase